MIGFILPGLILVLISIITLFSGIHLTMIYKQYLEPVLLHASMIFYYLFITFLLGAIGILMQLNQLTHPIFNYNLLFFSLSYLAIGFMFQNLSISISIKLQYLIFLLGLAPMYALAMIIGYDFVMVPALLSQIIPLIIVIYIDYNLFSRMMSYTITLSDEEPIHRNNIESFVNLFTTIFKNSLIVHLIGLISMFIFGLLYISGNEIQIISIWSTEWKTFDYYYFIALIIVLYLIFNIYIQIKKIAENDSTIDISTLINNLLL